MSSEPASSRARAVVVLAVVAMLCLAAFRLSRIDGAFSDNDRSRWATVRALVETNSFMVGVRRFAGGTFMDTGIIAEPGWSSIDVVMDPKAQVFYSSKPPFLAYLVSWPVRALDALGHPLVADRPLVTKAVLFFTGWLPLCACLVGVLFTLRRRVAPAALVLVVAAMGVASFLPTFVVTLTNHVPAAGAAALAIAGFLHGRERHSIAGTVLAGVGSAAAFALEPPAGVLLALLALLIFAERPGWAVAFFLMPAAAVLIVHFVTTLLVFQTPLFFLGPRDDWYEYAGSYWLTPQGRDVDDRSLVHYLVHYLVGHHGFFSLTPIAAFGVMGLAVDAQITTRRALAWIPAALATFIVTRVLFQEVHVPIVALLPLVVLCGVLPVVTRDLLQQETPTLVARVALATIVATLGFYAVIGRGYGGACLGPRWLLWLVPLWCLGLPTALTRVGARWPGRVVIGVAFIASAWLATPPGLNPWEDPKLYTPSSASP